MIAMPATSNWFKSVFTDGHLQQSLLYIFFVASPCFCMCTGLDSKACYLFYTKSKVY